MPVQTKSRVQFDFTEEALQTLDQLKEKLSLSSRADVIRYSLRILEWTLEQLQSDAKILVERNGKAQEVVFPFLKIREEGNASASAVTRFKVGA
ncbi:MAG: hypothetical protein WCB56_11460 [Terriglobales bacterium]